MSQIITCRDIFKDYARGKLTVPVLKHVTFTVQQGEYIAIMGPSGSGKTTLMNIIGCLDVPTSGTFLLDGEEISGLSENRMAEIRNKTLGFVFQHADLLPELTALDNVALPLLYRGVRKKERRARAAEVLEKVGLGDRMEFYPNQMSGGQCQRAAIARAIVGNPKLLLADEPTGALDSQSGKNIMQLFRQLNQEGITIITITHAAEVAQEADKCFHIYDGELFTDREVSAR
ncbi:ABC transporter ATP-binding protein [Butyricicoccus intestinisimiae]|jgi:putative ABC transport system ATP-binding protein|uniref:ABC transporter ATP-binding protein n=1 Tax=Butyricicoccus intestinisimiae TaxID=2841509 RepID=UPI003D8B1EA4